MPNGKLVCSMPSLVLRRVSKAKICAECFTEDCFQFGEFSDIVSFSGYRAVYNSVFLCKSKWNLRDSDCGKIADKPKPVLV